MRLSLLVLLLIGTAAGAEPPALKVLLCTGDYGMWAQDRATMIVDAVGSSAPGSVDFEVHQSYDLTRLLESPAFASRFDAIVISDVGIGGLTPAAQRVLVAFVQAGGGLVWGLNDKGQLPFHGAPEAVPMPLAEVLPIAYPAFDKPHPEAVVRGMDDAFFTGISWEALTHPETLASLTQLLLERGIGKGRVIGMRGGFSKPLKYVSYATFEALPGGWDHFPDLGQMWSRVLGHAGAASPVRATSRAEVDARMPDRRLDAAVAIDATRQIDDVRAANFSIVALQQLYNEDGAGLEALFLDLNPTDWFDRRSQEVMENTAGTKSDKPAFFKERNIRGIYMGDNSYGSYGKWDDAMYADQIAKAVAAHKRWPEQMTFFQVGNEPPIDAAYMAFHQRFVGGVLKKSPEYLVIGPNRAFNLHGVDPVAMEAYLDGCGTTTDVLNWHTYAQPPSTVLAEARYWSAKAAGRMRSNGAPKVMFTESDAWNQGPSQFRYLMDRAVTFLPEPTIIANFQYCMDPRSEGGTYRFGVLQPDGEFSANYNGYWIWRNLRGRLIATTMATPEPQDSLHALASISRDGGSVTVVAYYGIPVWRAEARSTSARVSLTVKLPPGTWRQNTSRATWTERVETAGGDATGEVTIDLDLPAGSAQAVTWTLVR